MHLRIPLHEPCLFCRPFVRVLPEQKLMKFSSSLAFVMSGDSRFEFREGTYVSAGA